MRVARSSLLALALAAASSIFGACGGGEASGLSITGTVYDVSTAYLSPLPGATVSLRRADDHATLTTAVARSDGSFVLEGVPAAMDVYIDVSKADYASFNSEVIHPSANLSGLVLYTALAANVDAEMNLVAWSDPPNGDYSSRAWFAMDIYGSAGAEVPGVTVTVEPNDVVLLYNNGDDVFLVDGPTAVLSSHSSASLVAGYGSVTGVRTFTLTDPSRTRTVTLPLVKGEVTYTAIYPW